VVYLALLHEAALAKAGLITDDIDLLIPHQANIRIIEAAINRLNVLAKKVYVNLDRYGDTSSASIPIALDEVVRRDMVRERALLVLVAFGAGLTWGATVLRWRPPGRSARFKATRTVPRQIQPMENAMRTAITDQTPPETAAHVYVRDLLDRAAAIRLPELFASPHPDALYRLPNRHGVSVVALRTSSLSQEQLTHILTYRLAQYLITGMIDSDVIYQTQMAHEPFSSVSAKDIHVVAGSPETGQIFSYMVLKTLELALPAASLRTQDRPLFPVEQVFGWGIYNHLNILPNLPIAQVSELARYVKNHQLDSRDQGGTRSPVEMGVAFYRIFCHSLRQEIAAVVGVLEERVAKRNLDFLHVPTVVIRGLAPSGIPAAYASASFRSRKFCPFAFLVSDFAQQTSRLAAVEQALERPGEQGIRALLALKRDSEFDASSLEPREGLLPLIAPEAHHYLLPSGSSAG
jgi:hypothetical protein